MGLKFKPLRDYHAWEGQIYRLEEQIWPQEVIWAWAWHELAESQEQTWRVGLGFTIVHSVSNLQSWGNDLVSQRGFKGLEFTTELAESRAWLDEFGWFVPRFATSYDFKEWRVLPVSQVRTRGEEDTHKLAKSHLCTQRVWSRFDRWLFLTFRVWSKIVLVDRLKGRMVF